MNPSKLSQAIESVLSDESDVRRATASHQFEFPYDRDAEAAVTRREFCGFLFLTSSALFVGAAGVAAKAAYESKAEENAPNAIAIDGAAALAPGSSLNFRYPGPKDTAILVRTRDGEFFAYGQKCTHLSCPVYYAKEHDRLECPCHEGGFDARSGAVLYGPPPRPLDRIELEKRGAEIYAIARRPGNEGA